MTPTSTYQSIVTWKPGVVTTTNPIITQPNPHQSNIVLNIKDFLKFSGDIKDQETYKTKVEAILGTTSYGYLLERNAASADERIQDKELYNVLNLSFLDGKAYSVISDSLKDSNGNTLPESGHTAWTKFQTWCQLGGKQQTIIDNIWDEIDDLKLDGDAHDGVSYVSKHIKLHNKLEHKKEPEKNNLWRMGKFIA